MRAKVYFHGPDSHGSFETEVDGADFKEWVLEIGAATATSSGWGYFALTDFAIPLRSITRIEKVED